MYVDRFRANSLKDPRLGRILASSIDAVDPGKLVSNALNRTDLPPHNRVYLLGLGKAAEVMTLAAATIVPDFTAALVITKHMSTQAPSAAAPYEPANAQNLNDARVRIMEAGHPIPDGRSIAAGHAALEFLSDLKSDDLLICLISGGGSALAAVPAPGVTLADLQALTGSLLSSGASIDEINVLRRRLDDIKGGGLAASTPATIVSLILSDVPGDHLEAIASGPTAPVPTTNQEAQAILRRRGVHPPPAITRALASESPLMRKVPRSRVENRVIGSNQLAIAAAVKQAEIQGFLVESLGGVLAGEAAQAGLALARRLRSVLASRPRPCCLVAGGETTVTVIGDGKGGRNQELALAAVDEMDGLEGAILVSLATDGEDGPTDAAGAVVTGGTRKRGEALGMVAVEYLKRNDAYSFFDSLGDLLRTGPTGTNVNDLVFLFGL